MTRSQTIFQPLSLGKTARWARAGVRGLLRLSSGLARGTHWGGGAVSYVTGSHHFKTGVTFDFGAVDKYGSLQQIGVVDLIQEYRLGVPSTVLVYNTPLHQRDKLNGN